jgi:hypothetical protein
MLLVSANGRPLVMLAGTYQFRFHCSGSQYISTLWLQNSLLLGQQLVAIVALLYQRV